MKLKRPRKLFLYRIQMRVAPLMSNNNTLPGFPLVVRRQPQCFVSVPILIVSSFVDLIKTLPPAVKLACPLCGCPEREKFACWLSEGQLIGRILLFNPNPSRGRTSGQQYQNGQSSIRTKCSFFVPRGLIKTQISWHVEGMLWNDGDWIQLTYPGHGTVCKKSYGTGSRARNDGAPKKSLCVSFVLCSVLAVKGDNR